MKRNFNLADHPIVVIISLIASVIGIFSFVSGFQTIKQIFVSTKPSPSSASATSTLTVTPISTNPSATLAFTPNVTSSPEGQYSMLANTPLPDSPDIIRDATIDDVRLIKKFYVPQAEYTSGVEYFFSSNILVTGKEGIVQIWNINNGDLLQTLTGKISRINDIAISNDRRFLATALNDHTIQIWQISNGELLYTLREHTGDVLAVVFSPDGNLLASSSVDSTLRIWDISKGAILQTIDQNTLEDLYNSPIVALSFSHNGKYLAAVTETFSTISPPGNTTYYSSKIFLWSIENNKLRLLKQIFGISRYYDSKNIVFSADDKLLALGSGESHFGVLDIPSGRPLVEPAICCGWSDSEPAIQSIAFSPDNQIYATGMTNKSYILLWNAQNTDDVVALDGCNSSTNEPLTYNTPSTINMEFSPNGALLASYSSDGTICLWGIPP